MSEMDVEAIYRNRFSGKDKFRNAMWKVLCEGYLQQFIPSGSTVAEIGAGYCEFINSIHAASKIAVDINPDTKKYAHPNVRVIQSTSTNLREIDSKSIDRVFASNYFEHLSHSETVATLAEVQRILKPDGMIIILQPNFRYCYKDYFMFFDHVTALDHRSMEEVLTMTGFSIRKVIPRFLPFTTQSRLPRSLFLLRIYLHLPILWKIFGGQMFIVAEPLYIDESFR